MQLKHLSLAALAGSAFAQMGNDLVSVLQNQTELSNLTSFLGSYQGVVQQLSMLSNVTLLAPSNDAFAEFMAMPEAAQLAAMTDMIEAILTYHVLNGTYQTVENTSFIPTALMPGMYANVTGGQRVEGIGNDGNVTFYSGLFSNSSVTGGPVNFTGGVIHIIDRLLMLPQNVSTTAIAFNLTAAAGAITQLNLTEFVDTTQDVTLFVPNNEAFQNIGSAVGNLTTEQLTGILSYHAVVGTVAYSTTLMNGSMIPTAEGANLTVRIMDDEVYVNNARVVFPDVLVQNGVVHVIDEVLNPLNATAMPGDGEGSNAFEGASSASDVPFTSGVPTPTSAIATQSADDARSSAAGSATSNPGWVAANPTGAMAPLALFGGAAVFMNL